MASTFENINSNFHDVFQAARLIRDDILKTENWKFTGSFENYQAPLLLITFIRWIIAGPNTEIESERRTKSIDIGVDNLTQIVAQAVNRKRQMSYKPAKNSTKDFYQTKETPVTVGLGLCIHKKTRSKEIVEILSNLNLSIDYDTVLEIETNIANVVSENMKGNNGTYIPPTIRKGSPVYFAVDNIDFRNDTPDGNVPGQCTRSMCLCNVPGQCAGKCARAMYPGNVPCQCARAMFPGNVPGQCSRAMCSGNVPSQGARTMYPGNVPLSMCPGNVPGKCARAMFPDNVPGQCAREMCPGNVP